jgi:hypothetical protein
MIPLSFVCSWAHLLWRVVHCSNCFFAISTYSVPCLENSFLDLSHENRSVCSSVIRNHCYRWFFTVPAGTVAPFSILCNFIPNLLESWEVRRLATIPIRRFQDCSSCLHFSGKPTLRFKALQRPCLAMDRSWLLLLQFLSKSHIPHLDLNTISSTAASSLSDCHSYHERGIKSSTAQSDPQDRFKDPNVPLPPQIRAY